MTFGTATLGFTIDQLQRAPAPAASAERAPERNPGGRPAIIYDCGNYGWLTVKQIAEIASISKSGIQNRINRGESGPRLCRTGVESRRQGYRRRGCNSPVMVTACRLALAYPDTIPTVEQIREARPMSLPAATRWRSAMRDARAQLGLAP